MKPSNEVAAERSDIDVESRAGDALVAPPKRQASAPERNGSCARKKVFLYSTADSDEHTHEKITRRKLAEDIARLTGRTFAGEYVSCCDGAYLVPNDTIIGLGRAHELGVRTERDLFGGVVPHAFMATKLITHELVHDGAQGPTGWSPEFGRRVRDAVLTGYSAFSLDDARAAGTLLLQAGPARLKPARTKGGQGQVVFSRIEELDAALEATEPSEVSKHGIVLEEELTNVRTYSIGQVRIAGALASYYGTQRMIPNSSGELVYGGSDLVMVRGGFDAVLATDPPCEARLALAQARAYDAAAMELFTGMFASRRNYDVAQGRNGRGAWRSGVLEQSWRLGGASGAELCGLQALLEDPALNVVRASCFEIHGESDEPPPHARVYFRGTDDRIGPITKYALVEAHADP